MRYLKSFEELQNKDISLDDVFNDCKPYIDMIKRCSVVSSNFRRFLRRGFSIPEKVDKDIIEISSVKNRLPKDTPLEMHNYLNDLFEDKFGWKVRNGVFCYLKEGKYRTTNYGERTYLLFPIGDFDFCYNPKVQDLFSDYESDIKGDYYGVIEYEEDYGEGKEGVWYFNIFSVDSPGLDKSEATNYILDNYEDFNIEKDADEDEDDFRNRVYSDVYYDLRWEPYISEEEYVEEKNTELKNKFIQYTLPKIISNYKDDDLCAANSATEISINCEKYYLVEQDLYETINERIWGNENMV